jgi:flagellar hook capping protein FlgD
MRILLAAVAVFVVLLVPGHAHAAATRAFVLTSDYSSGGLTAVDLGTRAVSRDVATVYRDAVERWYQGRLYVVNRYGADNIQVIDPGAGYATVRQFSVGPGTNPQDIAFVSPTRAYVSRLGSPDLVIVNPATGATLGSVSLARFADGDGNPEPARMTMVGSVLVVALQRLTNFLPQDTAEVALVDAAADTVLDADPGRPGVQAIALQARNPATTFEVLPDPDNPAAVDLLIGCVGAYGSTDGGVERIVLPATHAPLPSPAVSAGLVTTEATLGGDVVDIAVARAHAYAVVSDASSNTSVVAWDRVSGARLSSVWATAGFGIADVAVNDRDELWVCDNSFATTGVRVFRAGPDTLLAGPLDAGLPPVGVTFDMTEDVPASVSPPARVGVIALANVAPNPARHAARVRLALGREADLELTIHDVSGRRVRTLAHGRMPAGTVELAWDLTDERARRVAPGVYAVIIRAGADRVARKLLVIR